MNTFCLLLFSSVVAQAMTTTTTSITTTTAAPPIVYTIAGSDSGGGAGIQADLHAMHAFGCHGCSAITCLTAQNSQGVTDVHAPPAAFLTEQLRTLQADMPPRAIKIGMLGTKELAETVGAFLETVVTNNNGNDEKPWIVVDPVMISTSGHKLIDDAATKAMIDSVFPYADVLTPNKYEAEALLGRTLDTPEDVERGAQEILDTMHVKSVLIKGGHSLMEKQQKDTDSTTAPTSPDVNATLGYAQDYFLSSVPDPDEPRLCDGGVWIRTDRYDTQHTHGTGCTLSSAIASALALGHRERCSIDESNKRGAISSIRPIDACCLGKAYVTAGIGRGVGLGKGPGPVVHTTFPSTFQHYPRIALNPTSTDSPVFRPMKSYDSNSDNDDIPTLGRILPIVDSVEWVRRLTTETTGDGITDIQLRIKDETDPAKILKRVQECQALCADANVRLWINDYWEAAITAGCFGVHVGQEDLYQCQRAGGLEALRDANMAFGISTHSYGELAAALSINPTYISLGPIFGTTSKNVAFDPQGLDVLRKWRQLLPPDMPFVTIGGIGDATIAKCVREAGTDCAAVIGAITKSEDSIDVAVTKLNEAMS